MKEKRSADTLGNNETTQREGTYSNITRNEKTAKKTKPTIQLYGELQQAYDYFNKTLFGNKLRDAIITLNKEKVNTKGYYSLESYVNMLGEPCDEIALNPSFFGIQEIEDTLSTLVHEMAHLSEEQTKLELWLASDQKTKGKPSKGGYHTKAWGTIMHSVGLKPISLDNPGKETGQKVHHEIIKNGPYALAVRELVDEKFRINWNAKYAWMGQYLVAIETQKNKPGSETENENEEETILEPAKGVLIITPAERAKKKGGVRERYTCPNCGINVWGAGGLRLLCLDCDAELVNFEGKV